MFKKLYFLFFAANLTLILSSLASNNGQFSTNSNNLEFIELNNDTKEVEISKNLLIAHSPRNFQVSEFHSLQFEKNPKQSLALGYFNDTYWVKFVVKNNSNEELLRFLYLNSINGLLDLYKIEKPSNVVKITTSGSDYPWNLRPVPGIFAALPLKLAPQSTTEFLISFSSRHNINSKVFIGNDQSLKTAEIKRTKFLDFYAGGILLLVLYNLVIYFFLKEISYLLYCLFATSFLLTGLVINGALDMYLNPVNISLSHYLICFSSLSLFSATLFAFKFLEIHQLRPKTSRIFLFYLIISAILFFIGFTPFNDFYPKQLGIIIDISILTAVLFFIYMAIVTFKESKSAVFYLISWAFVIVSLIIWFGMTFGVFSVNSLTLNALPFANMAEMLTLSIALAYRIQTLMKEKLEASLMAKDKEKYERLVRVLSHDVANSLMIINSYSKKLSKSPSTSETEKYQIEKIVSAGDNIKNILNIVREQEMLVHKKKNFELTKINVRECLDFAKLLFEERLYEKNINLNINVPNDLFIAADKTCFTNNVVSNILGNSIKFSYQNSQIDFDYAVHDKNIVLIFKDYGIGIEKDLIHKIFFENSVFTSKGTQEEVGNGFGTNLVREYMTLFGGKVEVESLTHAESPHNHGTTIKLFFPVIS